MGVKVVRLVGDGVAVGVCPDAVRVVVARGVEAAQIGARVRPSPRLAVAAGDSALLLMYWQGCWYESRERIKERKEREGNKKGSSVPLPEPL